MSKWGREYWSELCLYNNVCICWLVQHNEATCICSERRKCLPCLERTAAHTLLSFSNNDNIQHANYSISSRARLEPNRLQCSEVDNSCARVRSEMPLTPPLMDTDVNMCCRSSRRSTAVDDSGMTPQMKSSRLAQVGRCPVNVGLWYVASLLVSSWLQCSGIFKHLESLLNRYSELCCNWPMSVHASQAFSILHCTDLEDLPSFFF